MRRHAYNETFYDGLIRKSTTPTALFHANHTLTQDSLHYRLATSGYRNKFYLPTLTFKEELQYTGYTLCFYEKNMYICTKQFIKI
ncbi:MAG: hypothetical protein HXN98_02490 [Prevotella salivae]|nr:hypothetical protein [Segatella salivae]